MPSDNRQNIGALPSPGVRQFTHNSVFGTVAGLLTALSSVFASVIIAHALGVAATGVLAFAMWIAMVAAAVVDLGVQASLARYLPELTAAGRADAAHWLAGMLWRWLAGSCLVALTGFVAFALWRWLPRRRCGAWSGLPACCRRSPGSPSAICAASSALTGWRC
jgi:O-antigen/teichoic acid export membrane protein